MQKNDTQLPIYTIYKNKLKMDERVKYKSWYHKSPRREYKEEIFRYSRKQYFHWYVSSARDIKERINKWDFIKIKNFCIAKENISKMNKEPIVWENIFAKDTSEKGFDLQNI